MDDKKTATPFSEGSVAGLRPAERRGFGGRAPIGDGNCESNFLANKKATASLSEGSVAGVSPAERRGFGGRAPINKKATASLSEGSVAGVSPAERRGFGGRAPINNNKPAFTFKELLFAYLAVSKLMYWMDKINAIPEDGLGAILNLIIARLLEQDIMTIWVLVSMFLLDHYIETHPSIAKGWFRNFIFYNIGYAIYVVSIVGYLLLIGLYFGPQFDGWRGLLEILFFYSIFYVIACVILNLKDRLKKKEAEKYILEEKEKDDTIALLSVLYERGVLTQEEFESKIK